MNMIYKFEFRYKLTHVMQYTFISKPEINLGQLTSICNILSGIVYSHFLFSLQTFKHKKKSFPEGTLKYDLHKRANASLHSGIDLKTVVKLPPEEDLNDWIAVHGKGPFTQSEIGNESEKDQRASEKEQRINRDHQRKFLLSCSFLLGLNTQLKCCFNP